MPQGSVLGPLLFALFCDDLPNCAGENNEDIEMYADDTTLYCIGDCVDHVVTLLNSALKNIENWSAKNGMTVHPDKSEEMLIKRGKFVGPLQPLLLNGKIIKWVTHSRILGLFVDESLKWTNHVEDLLLSYARKLNLLKSLRFVPEHMLKDFYWKVIFPSVSYGIVTWGSCNNTQFETLEKMHVRAAMD